MFDDVKVGDMQVGVRYVVTRESQGGEFQVGDQVWLEDDGSIMCPAARGWMPAEHVIEATDGWAIEVDEKWAASRRVKRDGNWMS